jgi:hypothetical protein
MRDLLKEILQFGVAITRAYITGGIIIAGLTIYERFIGRHISTKVFWWGLYAFFVVASFQAWRESIQSGYANKKGIESEAPRSSL